MTRTPNATLLLSAIFGGLLPSAAPAHDVQRMNARLKAAADQTTPSVIVPGYRSLSR